MKGEFLERSRKGRVKSTLLARPFDYAQGATIVCDYAQETTSALGQVQGATIAPDQVQEATIALGGCPRMAFKKQPKKDKGYLIQYVMI